MIREHLIEKDFKKLAINVSKVPEGKSILRAFPELSKHPEFKVYLEGLDKDKILRYIVYMYDKETPFLKKYPDVFKRKIETAKEAGFEYFDGTFGKEINEVIRCNNKKVNRMIIAYVRIFKSFKYSYFVTMMEIFYSLMNKIMDGELKHVGELKKTQKDLEETMGELLMDDQTKEIKDEFLEYIEKQRLLLRPEDIARKDKKSD